MITKLAEQYYSSSEVFTNKNCKGFNKAVVELDVPTGNTISYIKFIKSADGTVPTTKNSPEMNIYEGLVKIPYGNIVPSAGRHKYEVDITGATNFRVYKLMSGTTPAVDITYASLCFLQETPDLRENETLVLSTAGVLDVRDYKSAILDITVGEGQTVTFGAYKSLNSSPSSTNRADMYLGGIKVQSSLRLTEGFYHFVFNLKDTVTLNLVGLSSVDVNVCLKKEDADINILEKVTWNKNITFDTKAYNSLEVKVTASANTMFNISSNGTDVVQYIAGAKINKTTFVAPVGTTTVKVDCKDIDSITIQAGDYDVVNFDIIPSTEEINDEVMVGNTLSRGKNTFEFGSGVQLDFDVEANAINRDCVLEGSNDGENWDTIQMLNKDTNKSANKFSMRGGVFKMYANIQGYTQVRLNGDFGSDKFSYITIKNYTVHQTPVEGRILPGNWGDSINDFLKGYRWFKIHFKKEGVQNGVQTVSSIKNCSAVLQFRRELYDGETGYKYINLSTLDVYDRGMNLAKAPIVERPFNTWQLYGTPADGGFVIDMGTPLAIKTYLRCSYINQGANTIAGFECNCVYDIECFVKKPAPETCLTEKWERADYKVYELPSNNVDRDVLNNDVLEWSDNELTFWHGGYLGVKYVIPFNKDNVAHFVEGETINFAYLLPFSGSKTRNDVVSTQFNPSRIVVFTNTRVFYNYPNRGSNTVHPTSDMMLFDEAIIDARQKKWLPSLDKSATAPYRYFPVLKDYDYEQFNGRINGTDGFVDTYGNGGLPNNVVLQNIPKKGIAFWNRLRYSSMAKSEKFCAFGNYNTVDGSEPIVMCTNDGGWHWYVKAYFACTDWYKYMRGGRIDLTPITSESPYAANSLKLHRKRFNIPTDAVKEPTSPFIINSSDDALVRGFSVNSDGECLVELYPVEGTGNVEMDGVYPCIFFENVNADSAWDVICNNVTAGGGTNTTGVFFRLEATSTANVFKMYADLGNPYKTDDMVCRHIHAVNAVESGLLISTGESYGVEPANFFEGGFLYLIMQNMRNGGNVINLNAGSIMSDVSRLSSSPNGVIRACGAFLFSDDADPTLLYVSDEAFQIGNNKKRFASIPDRTVEIPITPAGVFVGKLSDIDDQSKFKCVCETQTTMLGLTESHGHFVADGHEHNIALSKNGLDWTIDITDGSVVNGTDKYGNIYFGNKVAVFK